MHDHPYRESGHLKQIRTSGKPIRVFFAIWPKEAVWRQLCDLSEKLELVCGGRRTRAESIHLTLIFLGEMETSQLHALCLAANTVRGQVFNFIVEGIRYWKLNRLVYAETGETPLELFDLVDSLKNTLSAYGISFDHRAFTPHITLVRKAQRHVLPKSLIHLVEPIVWPVNEYILVKSEQASDRSAYTPIGRWSLESQR
ncbi:MAG: RNA 2',3'-cyclic phosphodiesterase [Nitrosomonadaceae bacterium]|nr:RNA 2',3'-cyclic phosphodiesterase [Nitrosomonadaceae bacterium]